MIRLEIKPKDYQDKLSPGYDEILRSMQTSGIAFLVAYCPIFGRHESFDARYERLVEFAKECTRSGGNSDV
jgi:hypothetical protein